MTQIQLDFRLKGRNDFFFFLFNNENLLFQVEMNNGIVKVILSRPYGNVRGITYQGVENLLDSSLDKDDRGYATSSGRSS